MNNSKIKDISNSIVSQTVLKSQCDENYNYKGYEYDFKIIFSNSLLVYFFVLEKEFTKDEIIDYVIHQYKTYIDNYIYLKKYPNISTIDMADYENARHSYKREEKEKVLKKFIIFNKNSKMITEGDIKCL